LKFSSFLFPEATTPDDDHAVIQESLAEAKLCDALGFDVVWLAEHHFDGICAYVDPVSFAAALATCTKQVRIGFAVAQMSLHHPIRMAEQMSLIDNITEGRLIVGLGRGTAYNIYDYQGYGIDPAEAQDRLIEAEDIMIRAWTEADLHYRGRFWELKLPRLRPTPFTKPHPFILRAASGEESMVELAREGRPFMMNVQSLEVTRARLDLYRRTMRDAGLDAAHIARCMQDVWVWRNVYVAASDVEAERVAVPAFQAQQTQRARMRNRIAEEQGVRMKHEAGPAARTKTEHALLAGSPATVAARLQEIAELGVGGVILQFRLGPMSWRDTERSIRLFASDVMPAVRQKVAA
jgi:alkanesulfonate monooxygenase SsuD/methylene tetrahydromethanopterin reductase-like flavin-dependent oxidoreductase (luciferase family)